MIMNPGQDFWSQFDRHLDAPNASVDATNGGVPTNNTGVNGGAAISLGTGPYTPPGQVGQPLPDLPGIGAQGPRGPGHYEGIDWDRHWVPDDPNQMVKSPFPAIPTGSAPGPYGKLGNLGYGGQSSLSPVANFANRIVHMRNPQTGQVHMIPFDQVQAAQQAGGQVVG